jgi:hypothetical protein
MQFQVIRGADRYDDVGRRSHMGTIIRQPNGRWKARYRDANGRSRSQTFDRKQDAQDFQDDSSTDMRRGEWIDPRSRRITFDRIADLWWATTVRLRPTTRRGYHGLLERHVRPFFSGRRVVDLGYLDVEDFIAKKLDSGLSPKYTRDCTSVLSLIMKTAVKAGVRRDNPAAGHTIEVRQRKVRQGDGVIDMEQAHRLIAQVRDPYKPAVWLLVFTGMRPAELCGVRVKSADLVRGIVHVTETVLPVPKFGDEPYRSAVTGPVEVAGIEPASSSFSTGLLRAQPAAKSRDPRRRRRIRGSPVVLWCPRWPDNGTAR